MKCNAKQNDKALRSASSTMLQFLLSAITVVSCYLPGEAQLSRKRQWIFIHYHKTGHDLVNSVVDIFTGQVKASKYVPQKKRINILGQIKDFHQDIVVLHAPDMLFDWNLIFQSKERDPRIVHFVREPYDMVMSGYLYHSQNPSPSSESWERTLHFHPCSNSSPEYLNFEYQQRFASELGALYGDWFYAS